MLKGSNKTASSTSSSTSSVPAGPLRCAGCSQLIDTAASKSANNKDQQQQQPQPTVVMALGKAWHSDHFVCYQCERPIVKNFTNVDGEPHCNRCTRAIVAALGSVQKNGETYFRSLNQSLQSSLTNLKLDKELSGVLQEIRQQKGETPEAKEDQLEILVENILHTDPQELRKGKAKAFIQQIQGAEDASPPQEEKGKRSVRRNAKTKLLLILSRVSRVWEGIEYCEQSLRGASVEQERIKSARRNQSQSSNPIREIEAIVQRQSPENFLLCRICERRIALAVVKEHSCECMEIRNCAMKAYECDRKLRRLVERLVDKVFGASDEGESPGVLSPSLPASPPGSPMRRPYTSSLKALLSTDEQKILHKLEEIIKKTITIWHSIDALGAIKKSVLDLRITEKSPFYGVTQEMLGYIEKKIKAFQTAHQLPKTTIPFSSPNLSPTQQTIECMLSHRDVLNLSIKDFEILKPITRGGYARVYVAKKKKTGDIYAIKVMSKTEMIKKNQVDRIKVERQILSSIHNPFLVKLYYSFHSRRNLYLVMEYIRGGDCFALLESMGALPEEMAKAYIAETAMALEYLHGLGIVHRDIKPDNLLVTEEGHVKLVDFGLSQAGLYQSITGDESLISLSKTRTLVEFDEAERAAFGTKYSKDLPLLQQRYSIVGTPHYLAPEILLGTGHSFSVDWWSLGVVLFEFLTGLPPFTGDGPDEIFANILNRDIRWPQDDSLSAEAIDLIEHLLEMDPTKRYSAAELKQHPYFADTDWNDLLAKKMPFIPKLQSEDDTRYFEGKSPNLLG